MARADEPDLADLEWLDQQQGALDERENQNLIEENNMRSFQKEDTKKAATHNEEALEEENTKLCIQGARASNSEPGTGEVSHDDITAATNQEVLKDLERNIPQFGWNDTRKKTRPEEDYDLKQHLKGRGKVSVAFLSTKILSRACQRLVQQPKLEEARQ